MAVQAPIPVLKDPNDQTEVRKAFNDLAQRVPSSGLPIGFVYFQLPGQTDPQTLFGGIWLNITSLYAGLFFRAEGGNASAFNSGTQGDIFQDHLHPGISTAGASIGDSIANWTVAGASAAGPSSFGNTGRAASSSVGTVRTGTETRPINQTIRIWQRSS